jgi:hypothetical protein
MTELTTYEAPAPDVYYADPTGGRLVAWAEGLAAAHRIGSALCQTSFFPTHFRGKPEEAAAAILYGDEIGFTPTQAMQNLYVISGKPAMYARSMVALVMSKGHEVWTVEKSDAKVTVAGKRRGSNHVIEETWTPGRAQKAGYANNKKYVTDPQAMLYARAAADVCRQIAPDALAGLAYSAEEMELSEDQPTTTVRRAPAKAQRKVEAPEPELEPAVPASPEALEEERSDTQPVEPMTAKTRGHMFALFNELGIGKDDQLAGVSRIVGRPIESRADLSESEAQQVVNRLKVKKAERDANAEPVEPGLFEGGAA